MTGPDPEHSNTGWHQGRTQNTRIRGASGPDPEHSNMGGGHQGRTQNTRIRGHDVSGVSRKGGEYERGSPLLISSPEHEVLMVSYCDQSMSVVRRPLCVVRRQQFVLKAYSS